MKTAMRIGRVLGAVAILGCLAAGPATAQTGSWNVNANGNWSTPGSWLGNIIADGAGNTAWFTNDINAARTGTIDSVRTIGHIRLGDANTTHAFTLATNASGRLILDNGVNSATISMLRGPTTSIDSPIQLLSNLLVTNLATVGTDLIIRGEISGVNKGLTKSGVGRLILGATNTYTGATLVDGGILRLVDPRWLDTSSSLTLNGGVIEIMTNSMVRTGGLGSGSNQIQILGGASGFSFATNPAGDRSVTIGAAGTVLQWGSAYFNPSIFILSTTGATAGRTLILDNAIDLNGAAREIQAVAGLGRVNRSINGAGAASELIKTGSGTLDLNATNSYDGVTRVLAGALRLFGTHTLSTNNTVVLNGGVLEFARANAYQTPILGTGAGKVQFAGNAGFGAHNGVRLIDVNGTGETLKWGEGELATWGQLLLNGPNSGGYVLLKNGLDLNGEVRTISVNSSYGAVLGVVTNTGAVPARLDKTGGGTLVVLGDNYKHDGGTIIQAGTLQLGDYWSKDGVLPGIQGNAGSISNLGTILVANLGDTTLTGSIDGGGSLYQMGWGSTLTLAGTNRFTGNTAIRRGTIALDFSAPTAPGTNIIGTGSMSPLVLGEANYTGGTLFMKGASGAGVTNLQIFRSTTVNPGSSVVQVENGADAVAVLVVSNLIRAIGGTADFVLPTNGLIGTTTFGNFTGIITGALTVGRTDWAAAADIGLGGNMRQVTNYTGYTVAGGTGIAHGDTQNIRLTANDTLSAATVQINTLAMTNDGVSYAIAIGAAEKLQLGTVGGILNPAGAGSLTIGNVANQGKLTAGTGAGAVGELVFINYAASPIVVNAAVISNVVAGGKVTITKGGSGPLTFNGNVTLGSDNYLNEGAVTFNAASTMGVVRVHGANVTFDGGDHKLNGNFVLQAGSVTVLSPIDGSNREFQMNQTHGTRSALYLDADVTFNRLRAAINDNAFAAGSIFQTSGTFRVWGGNTAGLTLGEGANTHGYYQMLGGVVTGDVLFASRGVGVFEQYGGVVNPTNQVRFTENDGYGLLNLFGGRFNAPGSGAGFTVHNSAVGPGTAVFNILGGSLDAALNNSTKTFNLMNNAGNTTYLNLIAGSVTANQVYASNPIGNSVLNFNGGTLVAKAGAVPSNSFLQGLSAAYVQTGGALIDVQVQGAGVIVSQSLLAVTGHGLASIETNSSMGAQYIGAPLVKITGGSGTGALAIAQVDFSTGTITNFRVVNPGVGYQAADVLTVTVEGGGPLVQPTPFTVSGASLTANVSGGLTKLGSGLLTLAGTNTYTGGTTFSAGTLAVGSTDNLPAGALTFNGGNLRITGTTFSTLDGYTVNLGTGALDIDDARNRLTVSTALGGAGGLTKAGPGTLVLSGANSYLGNTVIQTGVLSIAGTGSLPGWNTAGRWTAANGGALAVYNSVTDADLTTLQGTGNLAAGARLGFDTTSGNRDYQKVFSNTVNGALGLVKLGNNMLTIRGSNTYSGGTWIYGGTLNVSNDLALGAVPGVAGANLTFAGTGGTFRSAVTMAVTNNRQIQIDVGARAAFDTLANTLTVNGSIIGAGGLVKEGLGRMILSATNSYTGPTVINKGILRLMDSRWIDQSSNMVINGGILELVSNNFARAGGLGTASNQIQVLAGNSGFSVIDAGGDRSVTIGGGGSEVDWGSTYFNPTIFVLASTGSTAGRLLVFDNAIDLNGVTRQIDTITGIGRVNRPITNGAGTVAGLVKGGSGTLDLAATNTYDGTTTILNGALRLSHVAGLSTSNTLILNGGVLEFNGIVHPYMTPMLGTGAGKVQFAGAAGFGSVSAVRTINVNGTGETLKMGDGALANWGVLLLNGPAGGSGHTVLANGLDLNGSSRTVSVAAGVGRIDGIVTNAHATQSANLEKIGGGTLLVLGDNYRHNGRTWIRAGTMQLGDYFTKNGVLPGLPGNLGSISNSGTLVVANIADTTLSGNIEGGGEFITSGWGSTLTLTGTNRYNGNTRIRRGTLELDFSAANAPATNIIGTAQMSQLVLGDTSYSGGRLLATGADGVDNAQTFRGIFVFPGGSKVEAVSGVGGAMYLTVSNFTRNVGGVVDFSLPASGAIRTTGLNTNGILGGFATVGGTDWAANSSGSGIGDIVAYTAYEDLFGDIIGNDGTKNVRLTNLADANITLAAPVTTIYTLTMNDAGLAHTINLAGQTLRLGTQGGILQAPSSLGLTIGSIRNDGFLTAGLTNNGPGELIFINNSASAITVNSAITSNGTQRMQLTKAGSGPVDFVGDVAVGNNTFILDGTATLKGTNVLGATYVTGGSLVFDTGSSNRLTGTLAINGGSVTVNGRVHSSAEVQIGSLSGGRGVLNINADLYTTRLRAALNDHSFSAGAIFQTGGILLGTSPGNGLSVSDGTGNSGYYRLSGGTVSGDVVVAYRGPAVFEQTGGSVTPSNQFQVVSGTGYGVVNLFGGQFNAPGTAGGYIPFQGTTFAAGTAVFNVLGGSLDAAYGGTGKAVDLMNAMGNTSYFNLLGGVVTANQIKATQAIGNSVLNLNGGTIVAAGTTSQTNAFIAGLSAAYVYAGGATVDVNGANVKATVLTGLQAPSGYGLTSIPVDANAGGQYIGAPVVRITGGSGTGALAVAQVDFSTGFITNLLVVNPGTGYQAADVLTVSLDGGGPLTAPTNFTVSGASLAANTSGGITKTGNGWLTLAGTNTFTGAIRVDAGFLNMPYAAPGATNVTLGATAGMVFGIGGAQTLTAPAIAQVLAGSFGAGNSFGLDTTAGSAEYPTAIGTVQHFYKLGQNSLTLSANNSFTGNAYVLGGALRAEWGGGLPATANLVLNGGAWETTNGLASNLGTGAGQFQIVAGSTSGFSAVDNPLTVDIGGAGAPVTWGAGGFNPTTLVLNATSANTNLVFANRLDMAGGVRTILVGADTAYMAGGLTNTAFASGQGTLIKTGAGTLSLTNAASMLNLQGNAGLEVRQGTLLMTAGKIQSQSPANYSDYIGHYAGDDGTLILAGSSIFTRSNATLYVGTDAGSRGTFIVQDDATFWGNYQMYVANAAGSTGTVTVTGGSLTIAQNNTVIGNSGIGRLILAGGFLTNVNTYLGNNAGAPGVMIQSGGVFRATGTTAIADKIGSAGSYIQTDGTYNGAGELRIANAPFASGYFEMQGGTRTNASWVQVGYQGLGLYYQSGGTNWVTGAGGMLLNNGSGTNGAIGVVYASGGVLTSALPFYLGYNTAPAGGGRAELTVAGGNVMLNNALTVNRFSAGAGMMSTNIVNLNSGTLRAWQIVKGATGGISVLNFDGGTLLAGASTSTVPSFLQGLDAAYVHDGGAVVDTAGNSVTIGQNLLAPAGSGVATLPWTGDVGGFVGAPYVEISGGGGFGATAVALFDYVTGSVTGLALTGAGSGYAPGDTLTVRLVGGGGPTTTVGSATLGGLASGALTKQGNGTLVLTGNNTFTGGTTIAAGTLVIGAGGTAGTLSSGPVANDGLLTYNRADDTTWNQPITGTGALEKRGVGVLTLGGANGYSGGTRILNGRVVLNANNALGSGWLTLGGAEAAGSLSLSNVSQTVNGPMRVESALADDVNRLHIGAGQSLVVLGSVTSGPIAANSITKLVADGAGMWAVTNAGGVFQVGGVAGDVGYIADVDLSALGGFSSDLGAGTFRIGSTAGGSGNATNIMRLATNSTIVAGIVGIGDFTSKFVGPNTLTLGAGANKIYADNLLIAGGKSDSRMLFDGATGTLTVSNRAGTGRANLAVGVNVVGTGGNVAGLLDTRGHEASLFLGAVTNGGRVGTSLTGWGAGAILFDQGTLDAQSMIVGIRTGIGSAGAVTGLVDIGGGTVNLGPVEVARNSVATNNSVVGTLNFRGGTITMSGPITRGGGIGTAVASLLMTNNAILDMGGFAIGGGGASAIDTLQLNSGTLRNVGNINGGAAWTKNGSGTLTIEGANGYGGNLTVAEGTLKYNGTYSGGGLITVQGGATLMGTGTVGNVTLGATASLKPGNSAGTLTVGNLTLDAGTTLEYDLRTVSSSDLVLAQVVALGGIEFADFTFLPGVGFGPGVYTLINGTSIAGLGGGVGGTIATIGEITYTGALSIDSDNQDLVLTVIPEPLVAGLTGLIGLAGWLLRRRLRV